MDIPLKDLISFHFFERQLFVRMVVFIGAHPQLAMEVIAFWLWLEEIGHPTIIRQLLELSDEAISFVAIEAKRCIQGLATFIDPISLTAYATFRIKNSPVNLNFLHGQRYHAFSGIQSTIKNVCVKIFQDLLDLTYVSKSTRKILFNHEEGRRLMGHAALGNNNNFIPSPMLHSGSTRNGASSSSSLSLYSNMNMEGRLDMYNLSKAQIMDNTMNPEMTDLNRLMMGIEISNPSAKISKSPSMLSIYRHNLVIEEQQREVPRDERTLFVTFSNGHPLKEEELRNFFNR